MSNDAILGENFVQSKARSLLKSKLDKDAKKARHFHDVLFSLRKYYRSGMINNATMLIILISGLIAGPAVSL